MTEKFRQALGVLEDKCTKVQEEVLKNGNGYGLAEVLSLQTALLCVYQLIVNHSRIRSPNKVKMEAIILAFNTNPEISDVLTKIVDCSTQEIIELAIASRPLTKTIEDSIRELAQLGLKEIDY